MEALHFSRESPLSGAYEPYSSSSASSGARAPQINCAQWPALLPSPSTPYQPVKARLSPPAPNAPPPDCLSRRAMGPPARQGRHTGSPFTARLRETLASLGNSGRGRVACRGVGHPRGGCERYCVPFNYDTRSE